MTELSITPREAFIYICFDMISADRDIDDREIDKLFEIIMRYGFQKEEILNVVAIIKKFGRQKAFENGLKSIEIARNLDNSMKQNLLNALLEIIESDKEVQDVELNLYELVKTELSK